MSHSPAMRSGVRPPWSSGAEECTARIAAVAADMPVGRERDAAVLAALIDMIQEWPGTGALIVGAFSLTREPEIMRRLSAARHTLMTVFGPDTWADEERHGLVSAIGAVTLTVMANRDEKWAERTDVVLAAGLGALGHHLLVHGSAYGSRA